MTRVSASGRIDPRVMERLTAAAALQVAIKFGIGADAVAQACSASEGDGFVAHSVQNQCTLEDRESTNRMTSLK